MTVVVTFCHPELETQVGASGVVVVPPVLSLRVAVAQSKLTVSGQVTLYQKDSVVSPTAAVKVWEMLESPAVADVAPAMAAKFPECTPDDTIVVEAPLVDQPENVPVSNPPFTIGLLAADAPAAIPRTTSPPAATLARSLGTNIYVSFLSLGGCQREYRAR
jgi:hypothetical protein